MLSVSAAAELIAAAPHGRDAVFTAVTTDSRKVAAGELFVALRGEKFDGHDYVASAIALGAVAAMVDKVDPAWGDLPLLVVADTRLALGQLAAQWRKRFAIPLAAVTGSNGKTTVKEMLSAILHAAAGQDGVLATAGNFNNDIGLPLTLLKLRDMHRYAVIEMGMNHPGEIAYLSALAKPDAALINNAQPAHLAGLGTVEAVARAKGEIFAGLAVEGTAIINADDPHADLWRVLAGERKTLTFGLGAQADVTARYKLHPGCSELDVATPLGRFTLALQAAGEHNVRNALAATAAALALGVDTKIIAQGLAAFSPVKGRLQAIAGLHGATLIDDSYNANPGSVRAAIDALAAYPGTTALVLGDMGELGQDAPRLHREIGAYAKQAGVASLFALGEISRETVAGFGSGGRHFEYVEDLLHEVENLLAPQVTVLVKGSRFMKMERVVKCLEEAASCC